MWDRTEAEDGDDVIEGCALITVPPNPLLAELQGSANEMPAILDRRDYAVWLTGGARRRHDRAQAVPAAADMIAHPVSPRINSFRYDDEHLIRPIGNISLSMSV